METKSKEWYSLNQALQMLNKSKKFDYVLSLENLLQLIFERHLLFAIKIEFQEERLNVYGAEYYFEGCLIQDLRSIKANFLLPNISEVNFPHLVSSEFQKNSQCIYKLNLKNDLVKLEYFKGYLFLARKLGEDLAFIDYAKLINDGIWLDLEKSDFLFSFDDTQKEPNLFFGLGNKYKGLDFKIKVGIQAFYICEDDLLNYINNDIETKWNEPKSITKTAAKKTFLQPMLDFASELCEKNPFLSYAEIYKQTREHFEQRMRLNSAHFYSQKRFTAFLKERLYIK